MAFAIIDCEGILVTKKHICIRSMYILLQDGITEKYREFVACIDIKDLEQKYRQAFNYCRRHIHKLDYYPKRMSGPCYTASTELNSFIKKNNI